MSFRKTGDTIMKFCYGASYMDLLGPKAIKVKEALKTLDGEIRLAHSHLKAMGGLQLSTLAANAVTLSGATWATWQWATGQEGERETIKKMLGEATRRDIEAMLDDHLTAMETAAAEKAKETLVAAEKAKEETLVAAEKAKETLVAAEKAKEETLVAAEKAKETPVDEKAKETPVAEKAAVGQGKGTPVAAVCVGNGKGGGITTAAVSGVIGGAIGGAIGATVAGVIVARKGC